MAPRRKSALEDLIKSGLVADGELLRYKNKQGQLMGIGRAREGGVEVDGTSKLLGYGQFEEHAGSKVRRPAEHTHTSSSRTLQGLQLLVAGDGGGGGGGRAQRRAAAEAALDLLEDENDDLCHACGLGGDLMCCETCPAVYHPGCMGLQAPPEGDFYCPACRCTQCGAGGSDGTLPTGCHWVDCSTFQGPDALQEQPRPHVGPAGAPPAQAAAPAAAAAAAEEEEGGEHKMEVEQKPEAADFQQLVAAAHAEAQLAAAPAEAAAAAEAARGAAAAAPGGAAVPCAVSHGWAHVRCFPAEFGAALRESSASQPCISSEEAITACTRLAAACAAGVLPLGCVAEGARTSSSGGANGSADARAPLPVSLLVVRGAAVAAPGTCRGYAPAYSPAQQEQLQAALSAALHVVHSCYAPIPDSRTGADIIPWLLRGAVLGGGAADFSATHTALLLLGQAVVGVAVFRSFGAIAELPLLAVRPELQRRNGLGGLLLAAVEQLLLQAGAQWLLTPAFAADGQPYLPHQLAPPADGQPHAAPALLQGKWGYGLVPAEQALAAASHPLVRLPGTVHACKRLGAETVLPAPVLPQRLHWSEIEVNTRQLLRDGLLAPVAPAPGAAEAVAAATEAAAAAAKAAAASAKPPRPPFPAALQQQQTLTAMYQQQQQQQMLAQQAAAAQAGTSAVAAPGSQQLFALYQQQQMQQAAYLQQLQAQDPQAYAHFLAQQQAAAAQQQPSLLLGPKQAMQAQQQQQQQEHQQQLPYQ